MKHLILLGFMSVSSFSVRCMDKATIFEEINTKNTQRMRKREEIFEQLRRYETLYQQFCVAQAIKQKFFEKASCFNMVQATEEDTFNPTVDKTTGKLLIYTTNIKFPIGSWRFASIHSYTPPPFPGFQKMFAVVTIFWNSFFSEINAEFYESGASRQAPNPTPNAHTYQIKKSITGQPIPIVNMDINQEDAEKIWYHMKERYQAK